MKPPSAIAPFLPALALVVAACVDDLRPSTFTSGWSEPGLSEESEAADPDDDFTANLGGEEGEVEVYRDWRIDHDPTKPCPDEMVRIAASTNTYCIDKWEGSLLEISASGPRAFPATMRPGDHLVRAQSKPNTMPQGYISGAEAQRACQTAGKRLCTDWEWWRACAGPKKTIYPYGTVHKPRACNEARPLHPVLQLYGGDAGPKVWFVEPMNNPAINAQSATVAWTGARSRCVSAEGVFDIVGNLHEWTADPAGTFHGGAYSTKNGLGCQYITEAHRFSYHDYSTGFRCCTDPYQP